MTVDRKFAVPNSLILAAIGLALAATGLLIAFPGNLFIWNVGSWTLAFALLALLGLVLSSGHSLVTNPRVRTWQRIASFALGLVCLAVIAIGSL
ncbi:hypothetical protein [Lysobacter tyrosinilyticus]